jgi:hypothetical protein
MRLLSFLKKLPITNNIDNSLIGFLDLQRLKPGTYSLVSHREKHALETDDICKSVAENCRHEYL